MVVLTLKNGQRLTFKNKAKVKKSKRHRIFNNRNT